MPFSRYKRLLRLWETNWGRDAGWVVEMHGQPIASLVDANWKGGFWVNYRIEIITKDPTLSAHLLTDDFWLNACANTEFGVRLRNREFNEFAADGVWIAVKILDLGPDRINTRALHLDGREPMPWDRLILWIRRKWC